MKIYNNLISKCKEQKGLTAVVIAIAIAMLFGFVALAVDVGYVAATKNELQNVADSAALAATGYLGDIYIPMTQAELDAYDCSLENPPKDCASIIAQALDVVGPGKNKAGGQNIAIDVTDVIIGKWNNGPPSTFTPTTSNPDAVKVTARRDSSTGGNGPITTLFAGILGIDTVDVKADATADLSGLSKIVPGGLPIPVGIGAPRFDSEWCDKPIKFYPTNDLEACGGWHVYEDDKTKIKQDVLSGLLDGADPPFISPEAEAGDIFYFRGGTDNAAYTLLKQVFDEKKIINDLETNPEWPIDGDLDPETWTTTVVVYDWDDCSNPNTFIPIVGFAAIRIYEICTATSDPSIPITGGETYPPLSPQEYCVNGEKQIVATISCEITKPDRGGGGDFGITGAIPGLVE